MIFEEGALSGGGGRGRADDAFGGPLQQTRREVVGACPELSSTRMTSGLARHGGDAHGRSRLGCAEARGRAPPGCVHSLGLGRAGSVTTGPITDGLLPFIPTCEV